ncbi:MAG: hypothetical protein R2911_35210 [Caldilineaceae bacterium]
MGDGLLLGLAASFDVAEVNMFDWQRLFYDAVIYGLALSLVLTILLAVSGAIALDMFVDNYPPDIKQKYGPMSPRSARMRPYFGALLFLTLFAIPMMGLLALQAERNAAPFLPASAFAVATLFVFNLFDLMILDWLLFCTIQPRMMVLPGTEGMAGYGDYRFHFVGFLKGLGFSVVGGLLIATLWTVCQFLSG